MTSVPPTDADGAPSLLLLPPLSLILWIVTFPLVSLWMAGQFPTEEPIARILLPTWRAVAVVTLLLGLVSVVLVLTAARAVRRRPEQMERLLPVAVRTGILLAASLVLVTSLLLFAILLGVILRIFGGALPSFAGFLLLAGFGSAFLFGRSAFRALRIADPKPGVPVEATDQPRLLELVASVARRLGIDPPEAVEIGPSMETFVALVGTPGADIRPAIRLHLSLGALSLVDADQAESIVAHELGHVAASHPLGSRERWTGFHRLLLAREVLRTELPDFGRLVAAPGISWVDYAIAALWLPLAEHRREEELEADRMSTRIASREAVAGALATSELAFALEWVWAEALHERAGDASVDPVARLREAATTQIKRFEAAVAAFEAAQRPEASEAPVGAEAMVADDDKLDDEKRGAHDEVTQELGSGNDDVPRTTTDADSIWRTHASVAERIRAIGGEPVRARVAQFSAAETLLADAGELVERLAAAVTRPPAAEPDEPVKVMNAPRRSIGYAVLAAFGVACLIFIALTAARFGFGRGFREITAGLGLFWLVVFLGYGFLQREVTLTPERLEVRLWWSRWLRREKAAPIAVVHWTEDVKVRLVLEDLLVVSNGRERAWIVAELWSKPEVYELMVAVRSRRLRDSSGQRVSDRDDERRAVVWSIPGALLLPRVRRREGLLVETTPIKVIPATVEALAAALVDAELPMGKPGRRDAPITVDDLAERVQLTAEDFERRSSRATLVGNMDDWSIEATGRHVPMPMPRTASSWMLAMGTLVALGVLVAEDANEEPPAPD